MNSVRLNIFILYILISLFILASDYSNQMIISDMKFFMWYQSYAIYGARETLILLKPDIHNSTVSFFF
jgi:hypothetical protein